MHWRALLMLTLAACTPSEPQVDPTPDASEPDSGEAPTVEIGTGQDDFVPLTEGELVPLNQGTQGGGRFLGYHIWSAVRAKGFEPKDALLEFVFVDSTGTEQARQSRQLTLLASGDAFIAYGFAPRIQDCCAVSNQAVTMQVRLEDGAGLVGSDERTVMAGPCVEVNSGQLVCP